MSTKSEEYRVRSLASRRGYLVIKSRRAESIDNRGEYMLVDRNRNAIVLGDKYDATLDEIEAFVQGERTLASWNR